MSLSAEKKSSCSITVILGKLAQGIPELFVSVLVLQIVYNNNVYS